VFGRARTEGAVAAEEPCVMNRALRTQTGGGTNRRESDRTERGSSNNRDDKREPHHLEGHREARDRSAMRNADRQHDTARTLAPPRVLCRLHLRARTAAAVVNARARWQRRARRGVDMVFRGADDLVQTLYMFMGVD
jgi:hypothetical protein